VAWQAGASRPAAWNKYSLAICDQIEGLDSLNKGLADVLPEK
jgi:hypothetical protein